MKTGRLITKERKDRKGKSPGGGGRRRTTLIIRRKKKQEENQHGDLIT
jgi:hypothetical protein